MAMKIALGADHLGVALKDEIAALLRERKVEFQDFGVASGEVADYPDMAEKVARSISDGQFDRGILVCGTGIGMAIAAPVLCWVFYTTSSGMVDIMQKEPGDWIGLGGAVIATTAILVMLASTSWSLGADLASLIAMRRMARERVIIKTSITALVFVFVFSISAFFSFTYYYNNIFKLSSKKIVGELQPMELAADVLLPAAKTIKKPRMNPIT